MSYLNSNIAFFIQMPYLKQSLTLLPAADARGAGSFPEKEKNLCKVFGFRFSVNLQAACKRGNVVKDGPAICDTRGKAKGKGSAAAVHFSAG